MYETVAQVRSPLRPRGVLEVVDAAAEMLRRRTRDVAIIASIAVIPVVAFAIVARVDAGGDASRSDNSVVPVLFDEGDLDITLFIVQAIVASVLFSVVTFAMTRVIVASLYGLHVGAGAAIAAAVRRLPHLAVLWVLVHVCELLGLLTLGIGTLIAMAGLMVTVPAMAAEEGLGPVGAFRRSWNLTNGAKGHVFGILLVLFVVAGLLNSVLVIGPASLVGVWLDGWAFVVVSAGLQSVASVVVQSIVSGATVFTYLDLRVRREGLDLDLRLREGVHE